jgi:putative transposase
MWWGNLKASQEVMMPRKPRIDLPGLPQHVIQRGNNREPCFYAPADYQYYLETLGEALVLHDCQLHAYVLMTNHVHLLITPLRTHGISYLMQATGRKYVQYINRTYRRSGTLWEGRYKASLIDSDGWLLTCMRYIEMNPVRADMVAHPSAYGWSSYRSNAQGGRSGLITPHGLYLSLGSNRSDRQYAYRQLFAGGLEAGELHEIRAMVNQGLVLGREDFRDRIARMTRRQVRRGRDGRPSQTRTGK